MFRRAAQTDTRTIVFNHSDKSGHEAAEGKTMDTEHSITIRMAVESIHYAVSCSKICMKGCGDENAVQAHLAFITTLGLSEAEITGDQELAAAHLRDELGQRSNACTSIPRSSSKGSKGSLGLAELGHIATEGQPRTWSSAPKSSVR